jgi:hypothetical protein
VTGSDLSRFTGALRRFGFEAIECPARAVPPSLDGAVYDLMMLDMGPASVDGWLARLVGVELGEHEAGFLDVGARCAVLPGGQRVPLTRKEFELIRLLAMNEGRALSRDELLDQVWGRRYAGGSNVVDVIVASLRRKLGPALSARLVTVRGLGYRLLPAPP